MSSKEATPATPGNDVAKETKPLFTPKEENLLKVAMVHCLKSGPPEIDFQKFVTYGGFNTLKTAQNTWGSIKKKLNQAAGPKSDEEKGEEAADGVNGNTAPKTPKTPKTPKAAATPASKKRNKKADAEAVDGEVVENGEVVDEAGEAPKKKQRKSPVKKTPKKTVVKVEADAEDEGAAANGVDGEVEVKAEAEDGE